MFRMMLCVGSLIVGVLATLPSDLLGQQKNKNPKNQPVTATEQDYYLIQNQPALTGKVLSFDDASHTASIRVDFPEWVRNPKYKPNKGAQNSLMNDYNRLQQEQQRLATAKKPQQAQQHYNNIMNLQNRIQADMARANNVTPNNMPFVQIHHVKDFEFELQEKVTYRKMFLPVEYDDTGNLKSYTTAEKDKLRGKNEPKGSYSATPSEFHPGQGVWVYLSPPKKDGSTSTPTKTSSSAAKEKQEDEAEAKGVVPHPTIKMLVLHTEGTIAPTTVANPKKKKN